MALKTAIPATAAALLSLSAARICPAQTDWRKTDGPVRMYNTAKQKLAAGKQIVGGTVLSPDPNIYCAWRARDSIFSGSSAKGAVRTARGSKNWLAPHSVLREFLKRCSTARSPIRTWPR